MRLAPYRIGIVETELAPALAAFCHSAGAMT